MYAVIQSGGKQYRVEAGTTLKLEKLTAQPGEQVQFDKVLLLGQGSDVKVGKPYLKNGLVTAEVVTHGRGKKIKIVKFRRRKHHRKQMGHRQDYTQVKIVNIKEG